MAEDIFEESKITIEATLKEDGFFSGKYTGKLDLVYQKNDAEIKKESDIDVPAGTIQRVYDVPKVLGTEETYNLKVVAHYGKQKEKTRLLLDSTVWPKKVKLTAKDIKDNSPAKKIAYEIKHTNLWFGSTTAGNTDDNGVGNEDLKKSPYTISVSAPWELVANKNDAHKREHELDVRCNPKAKFLKPDITQPCYIPAGEPTADKKLGVRQYVNAPTAAAGCDANGSIIEFEVCHKDVGPGRNGDKIYIQVKFAKLSKRSTPKPALLSPCMGIAESDGGKTLTGHTLLTGNGGSAKFRLELGYAGGETFTVSCGYSKDDPSDDKLIFVTWRKVTYQLCFPTLMKVRMTERSRTDGTKYFDMPDSIFSVVKNRLKPVFVEYENVKSLEYTPPVGDPCITTRGFVENSADTTPIYVTDERIFWNGGAPAFDPVPDNRETTITFCDLVLDLSDKKTRGLALAMNAAEMKNVLIDDQAAYKYFPIRPGTANTPNANLAGKSWTADLSAVSVPDKTKKPAITITPEEKDYDDWNEYQINEKDAGGGPITICFADSDDLYPADKTALKNYYEKCFTKPKAIRQNFNQLKFTISGATRDSGDKARLQAITAELNSIHTASAKTILYHPGLDADGNPRTGPMTDVEITHPYANYMNFKLPARANPTDPFGPGDFAGAASPTTCPVNISFTIYGSYTYNGHAGGGSQLLVYRNAPGPAIASTVCHELGHAMGMSIMPLPTGQAMPIPPGLPPIKHVDDGGTYYRNNYHAADYTNGMRNRHQGPHCCTGMPTPKRPHSTFEGWGTGGATQVCIMWGEGGDGDDRTQYCPVCTEYIKARDLRDIRKQWAGSAEG
jgi:hypothetical protein